MASLVKSQSAAGMLRATPVIHSVSCPEVPSYAVGQLLRYLRATPGKYRSSSKFESQLSVDFCHRLSHAFGITNKQTKKELDFFFGFSSLHSRYIIWKKMAEGLHFRFVRFLPLIPSLSILLLFVDV